MQALYSCEARWLPPAKLNDWTVPCCPVNHCRQLSLGRQADPQLSCCTRMLHDLGDTELHVKTRLLQSDLREEWCYRYS